MSEPEASSPASGPPAAARRVACNWRRVRLYVWAILLALALWPLGGAYTLRYHPDWFIGQIFAKLPFAASAGEVSWVGPQTLRLRYVRLGDFFYADTITLSARLSELLRHHVRAVEISQGDLFMANLNRYLAQSHGPATKVADWTIGQLKLDGNVVVLDFGPSIPSVPVNVGLRRPVILNGLHLGTPDQSPAMNKEQTVEIENIHFSSPFDPLAPVLSLPLVRLKFTYAEIWHHQIRVVDLIQPNLFLGQDLFWFTDEFKKERATAQTTGPASPWKVGHFSVEYGQLSVNTFGQPRFTFPFFFDTQADDIQLDQLDKLSAKSVIAIRDFTRDYPEYKIRVVDLNGKLEFSIPPTDAKANNVVLPVGIKEISWNNIPVQNASLSATFDPTGIYARMWGQCEKGLLEGNFEIYYTRGFEWNGNFAAHRIDCAPIAEKLAGKYGSLTGVINGNILVQGKGTLIKRCHGELYLDQPGALRIESADRLIDDLPASMVGLRRQALQIGLQAFTYYPYTAGQVLVDYQPGNGGATLKLNGPLGRRDFSVYWHPFAGSEVAKDGENH